jgi:hypothetical protein
VTVKIDSEDTLSTLNIGDSGYTLLHPVQKESGDVDLKLVFRSEEGQKSFNFPDQIGS